MGVRSFQTMVPMRDGTRLNTFGFLPESGGPRFPVILHRTPYGIAAADARDKFDHTTAWLPSAAEPMRGSILRGWRSIVARGYVAVYQDCRGRHGSEGEDRVYADDATDGYDTLDWIAHQPWSNQRVGMSGSSAGATTTSAAASPRHPNLRAFFAQAGGSSIYDDVVYEGGSIEMERLWLWGAKNIPGLSPAHREAVLQASGISAALNFRKTIDIPGFHVTSWFDIFQTSVVAAFQDIQARTGTQKLWVGPNEHYFVYAENFWP